MSSRSGLGLRTGQRVGCGSPGWAAARREARGGTGSRWGSAWPGRRSRTVEGEQRLSVEPGRDAIHRPRERAEAEADALARPAEQLGFTSTWVTSSSDPNPTFLAWRRPAVPGPRHSPIASWKGTKAKGPQGEPAALTVHSDEDPVGPVLLTFPLSPGRVVLHWNHEQDAARPRLAPGDGCAGLLPRDRLPARAPRSGRPGRPGRAAARRGGAGRCLGSPRTPRRTRACPRRTRACPRRTAGPDAAIDHSELLPRGHAAHAVVLARHQREQPGQLAHRRAGPELRRGRHHHVVPQPRQLGGGVRGAPSCDPDHFANPEARRAPATTAAGATGTIRAAPGTASTPRPARWRSSTGAPGSERRRRGVRLRRDHVRPPPARSPSSTPAPASTCTPACRTVSAVVDDCTTVLLPSRSRPRSTIEPRRLLQHQVRRDDHFLKLVDSPAGRVTWAPRAQGGCRRKIARRTGLTLTGPSTWAAGSTKMRGWLLSRTRPSGSCPCHTSSSGSSARRSSPASTCPSPGDAFELLVSEAPARACCRAAAPSPCRTSSTVAWRCHQLPGLALIRQLELVGVRWSTRPGPSPSPGTSTGPPEPRDAGDPVPRTLLLRPPFSVDLVASELGFRPCSRRTPAPRAPRVPRRSASELHDLLDFLDANRASTRSSSRNA